MWENTEAMSAMNCPVALLVLKYHFFFFFSASGIVATKWSSAISLRIDLTGEMPQVHDPIPFSG